MGRILTNHLKQFQRYETESLNRGEISVREESEEGKSE